MRGTLVLPAFLRPIRSGGLLAAFPWPGYPTLSTNGGFGRPVRPGRGGMAPSVVSPPESRRVSCPEMIGRAPRGSQVSLARHRHSASDPGLAS